MFLAFKEDVDPPLGETMVEMLDLQSPVANSHLV